MGALTIESIQTKSGSKIELPPSGVLCVVGGNNVGKSQFLRDIRVALQQRDTNTTLLIDDVEFQISIDPEQATDWLISNSIETQDYRQGLQYQAIGGQQAASPVNFRAWLAQKPKPHLDPIMDWFVRVLDAAQRSAVATIEIGSGSVRDKSNAMHMLFRDGDLEVSLSAICEKDFGFPLTLDRANGNVMLRVGKSSIPSPPHQRPSKAYSDDVLKLPPLHDQGDGVKNYLGMVLHLMTSVESVTLFDEPEAFLHPAQARALGRHLGREVTKKERQLITATHDRDFVLGLLDSNCPLTIMRINREGNTNTFTSINSSIIANIWSKPALRYSNLLQGLFHRTVVLCEADGDCQWYAAVAETIGQERSIATDEILFVPGGGKEQLPSSLAALNALEVSAFTITDFDSLLDPDYLESLLNSKKIRNEEIISKARGLKKSLDNDGRMRQAKESGLAGIPSGTTTETATDLISKLRKNKILIVPYGELESFDKQVGKKGPSWVSAALNNGSHQTSHEAKALMAIVVESLATVR
jgi:hypothetical protein